MTPLDRIRIEKAAADCGFEREPVLAAQNTLELRSALFPEVLHVRLAGPMEYALTASLPELLPPAVAPAGDVVVSGIKELYAVLQHAAALARTLPHRIADRFRKQTEAMPKATEAQRLAVQRVGQDLFRGALLDYWQGRCCVTGLDVPSLLRASHIKPWAKCASDNERLDVFNGLLLAPHLDALFDGGWITFSDCGGVMVSGQLSVAARGQLALSPDSFIHNLTPLHAAYLAHHRENVFRLGPP